MRCAARRRKAVVGDHEWVDFRIINDADREHPNVLAPCIRTRRLDGRESAVDGQCGAVDVRGVVAHQERDRGCDLF
jgi:hypothetical protein